MIAWVKQQTDLMAPSAELDSDGRGWMDPLVWGCILTVPHSAAGKVTRIKPCCCGTAGMGCAGTLLPISYCCANVGVAPQQLKQL